MAAPLPRFDEPIFEVRVVSRQRIVVRGELDVAAAPTLLEVSSELLDASDGSELQIDLEAVSFIDCAGLGVLVRIGDLGRERDRLIKIISSSRAVHTVARLAGLAHLITRPGPVLRLV